MDLKCKSKCEHFPPEKLKLMFFSGNQILSTQNEKLTFERTYSEESVNKLRKVNAELRVGTDQCENMLVFVSTLQV